MIPLFKRKRRLLLIGDVVLILLSTYLSPLIRLGHDINIFTYHTGASLITIVLYIVILYIFDLYNIDRSFRSVDTALKVATAVAVAGIISSFLFYSLPNWKFGRGIFFIQIVLVWSLLLGWRWLCSLVFHSSTGEKSILIIGAGRSGIAMSELVENSVSPYRVVGFLDDDPVKQGQMIGSPKVIGTTDQLIEVASKRKLDTTILAINYNRPPGLINSILKARLRGITILEMPTLFEQLTRRIPVEHIYDEWLLFTQGFYLISKQYLQRIKRLIDLGISLLVLLISLPIIAVAALAILLGSPGPILFQQDRVGKNDRIFTLWKLRTMKQGAETNGPVWAEKNDHRVTWMGKWLRLLRIDELPQLYNVLRGEMSLIGPRPERPTFVKDLEAQIPYYSVRHTVRPGITGWAQVNYRYGASVKDAIRKLEYDLYYIKNMSLILDLKIMLRTIGVVIFGQGAR